MFSYTFFFFGGKVDYALSLSLSKMVLEWLIQMVLEAINENNFIAAYGHYRLSQNLIWQIIFIKLVLNIRNSMLKVYNNIH